MSNEEFIKEVFEIAPFGVDAKCVDEHGIA